MQEQIVFGPKTIPVTLPDDVITAPPGLSTTLTAHCLIRHKRQYAPCSILLECANYVL